jgi:hypothetical protein
MSDSSAKDPREMFQHAETFLGFLQIARSALPEDYPDVYNYPLAVNHAFCLEIYLKCLVILEGGTPGRDHRLKNLFELLDPSTQEKAKRHYDEIRSSDPYSQYKAAELKRLGRDPERESNFDAAILSGSDAFVKMRYAYEGIASENYLLMPLEFAIRRIILERNPSWKPAELN